MTQTSDELRRQVVTLLQQSADLKIEAQRLLKAANELRHNAATWLVEHEYASIRQLQGSMSQRHAAFPAAFERTHYVRAVSGGVPSTGM